MRSASAFTHKGPPGSQSSFDGGPGKDSGLGFQRSIEYQTLGLMPARSSSKCLAGSALIWESAGPKGRHKATISIAAATSPTVKATFQRLVGAALGWAQSCNASARSLAVLKRSCGVLPRHCKQMSSSRGGIWSSIVRGGRIGRIKICWRYSAVLLALNGSRPVNRR